MEQIPIEITYIIIMSNVQLYLILLVQKIYSNYARCTSNIKEKSSTCVCIQKMKNNINLFIFLLNESVRTAINSKGKIFNRTTVKLV